MSTVTGPHDSARGRQDFVMLRDVDWETYTKLRDADPNLHTQMTYDRGALYLMSPGRLHERIGELLARMIYAWTENKCIAITSAGSTTLRSELLDRGFEPDKSFYVENEAIVRGRDDFDPQSDPPPDLTIEVDVTSLSTVRMPIYAAFGVPEVWRWFDDGLAVHRLEGNTYAEVEHSVALPGFPLTLATTTLQRRNDVDETRLIAEFRKASTNF